MLGVRHSYTITHTDARAQGPYEPTWWVDLQERHSQNCMHVLLNVPVSFVMVMPRHASQAAIARRAALRRLVAGLCVLALVAVGFAHCIQHLGALTPATASQVDVDKSDALPNSPHKAGLVVEHCLGCTIVAVVPSYACDLAIDCGANIGVAEPDAVRSHDLAPELPPPKSST